MSTHFDGVNNTDLEVAIAPLIAAGSVPTKGIAVASLWRPLAVDQSGLFYHGGSTGRVNPYSDGRIYFTYAGGSFVHSGQGSAAGTVGEFYTATDGWRIDVFANRTNGSSMDVDRHTYFFDTGVWTHTLINTVGASLSATFSNPCRIGTFSGTEGGLQNIAAMAVWAGTAASFTDAQFETLSNGLYAWNALSPTALWSFEDATSITVDPLGTGIGVNSIAGGVTHSADEPAGWTYSLTPPSSGALLQTRVGGILVPSSNSGVARANGVAFPFGP